MDTGAQIRKTRRMFYMDNLRLLFTFVVILHHVCLTYAAQSGWYFYEHLYDSFTNLFLNVLMAVNRTWVLGCFFMISGYFTPGSLDRKGTLDFMKDRLIRIGIPLAIFAFLVRPTIVYFMNRGSLAQQYTYLENIFLLKNAAPGPAWFLEVLLTFSFVYALWRRGRRVLHGWEGEPWSFPSNRAILVLILVLAAFTFVLRIFLPTEKQILHLRLGNYAEYVAFFALGITACRLRWLDKLTDRIGRQWTAITVAAACLYTSFVVLAWSLNMNLSFFRGGLSLKTLVATYVETFIAVGSNISLVYLFRKFANTQPGPITAMARDAYAVFIFHAPVIVAVSYLLQGRALEHPFAKFVLVFVLGTTLSFLICRFLVRKIPCAQKVL